MNDKEYSKKTWIITAILAVAALIMDVVIWATSDYALLRDTSYITIAVAGYILVISIKKIIEKTKQEKEGKEE